MLENPCLELRQCQDQQSEQQRPHPAPGQPHPQHRRRSSPLSLHLKYQPPTRPAKKHKPSIKFSKKHKKLKAYTSSSTLLPCHQEPSVQLDGSSPSSSLALAQAAHLESLWGSCSTPFQSAHLHNFQKLVPSPIS